LKALVLRFPDQEHQYTPFLSGSAMIMKKEVLDQVRFQEGDSGFDTQFVRDCLEKGMKLYSCDKYNHVRIVTKKEDEYKFLQKSEIIAYTEDYKTHVTV
jgi:hypothetical protein